jgi:hypothetical protein
LDAGDIGDSHETCDLPASPKCGLVLAMLIHAVSRLAIAPTDARSAFAQKPKITPDVGDVGGLGADAPSGACRSEISTNLLQKR